MKKTDTRARLLFALFAFLIAAVLPAGGGLTQQSAQPTTEVSLGRSSGAAGGTLTVSDTTSSRDQDGGPESLAFDGTYIWVTRQFRNAAVRLRASDGLY
jgi:hypothetical protein